MLKDVLERIEQRLAALEITSSAASISAGLSEDAIRNIRRAVKSDSDRGVSTNTILALAPVLQTTASWLLEGIGEESSGPALSPVIGKVDANANGRVIRTTSQLGLDRAPRPPGGTSKAVALEVDGHSMRGWADHGSLIYFEEQRTTPTRDMMGEMVVVELPSGEILVKRLLRGSEPGLYDLESVNGPTLTDQRVVWVAHITAIVPPVQARRVIVRDASSDAA